MGGPALEVLGDYAVVADEGEGLRDDLPVIARSVSVSMYPFIPVVKTVSPVTTPEAPSPLPSNTSPFARTRHAFV